MFEVVYDLKSGNTKKLALAIATELGVQAENVREKGELTKGSFVLLGSGCYAAKPGRKLRAFIKVNDFRERRVALFGTSGDGQGTQIGALEELLKPMGAIMEGSFHCPGRFLFQNRERPNEEDLMKARAFANRMKNSDVRQRTSLQRSTEDSERQRSN